MHMQMRKTNKQKLQIRAYENIENQNKPTYFRRAGKVSCYFESQRH